MLPLDTLTQRHQIVTTREEYEQAAEIAESMGLWSVAERNWERAALTATTQGDNNDHEQQQPGEVVHLSAYRKPALLGGWHPYGTGHGGL